MCPSVQGRARGRRLQPHQARAAVVPVRLLQEAQGEDRPRAGLQPSALRPHEAPTPRGLEGSWSSPQRPQALRDEGQTLTAHRGERWPGQAPQGNSCHTQWDSKGVFNPGPQGTLGTHGY